MSIKLFLKLAVTALVLSYPLLAHWVLPHWATTPGLWLTLPPSLLNAWLAWLFGRTLLAGREPMIAIFARIEQASLCDALNQPNQPNTPLPPDLAAYARALTVLWSALFVVLALVSLLLAASGMLAWWAWFVGPVSYLAMGTLFFGEYLFRRWRFAQYPHAQPFQLLWMLVKSGPIWLRGR